jgi:hypothetical protein
MPNGSCLPEFSQIFSPNPHLFSSYTSWMSASVHSRTSGPSAFSVWNPLGDGVFPFFPVGSLWTPSVLTTGLPPPTVSFYRYWGILVATSRPPPPLTLPTINLPHLPNERPAPRLLPRAVVPPLHHSPGGSCCLPGRASFSLGPMGDFRSGSLDPGGLKGAPDSWFPHH